MLEGQLHISVVKIEFFSVPFTKTNFLKKHVCCKVLRDRARYKIYPLAVRFPHSTQKLQNIYIYTIFKAILFFKCTVRLKIQMVIYFNNNLHVSNTWRFEVCSKNI